MYVSGVHSAFLIREGGGPNSDIWKLFKRVYFFVVSKFLNF